MTELLCVVRAALESNGLFRPEARLLCAVSGGADSVALLVSLARLRQECGCSLLACHVQHGLRGESSLWDEAFVRSLCDALGVALYVEDAGLAGSMEDAGIETRARSRRLSIFEGLMETLEADAVLLAHHRDDQAETVLMHLLRGAGGAGLCGMRSCVPFGRGVMLRPFLSVPKARLTEALKNEGIAWREDESNRLALTPRNALRLNVIPMLDALFPMAGAHIASAAEALAADEDCLRGLADELYETALCDAPGLFSLRKPPLLNAPEALARRVLRRWVLEGMALKGPMPDERALSHQETLALVHLLRAEAGEVCNLSGGLAATAGTRHLHLRLMSGAPLRPLPDSEALPLREGTREYLLGKVRILQEEAGAGGPLPASNGCAVLSPEILALRPVLRLPRAGDRVRPLGASGAKPLRRWMTDRKLDPAFRPLLPVLAAGSDILWIPSMCTAEELRLSRVPNGSVRLRLAGGAPYLPQPPKE